MHATIPLNAITALQALDQVGLGPRDSLLLTGAAGAVAQGRPDDEQFLRGRGAARFASRDEAVSLAVRPFVPEAEDCALDAAALGDPAL